MDVMLEEIEARLSRAESRADEAGRDFRRFLHHIAELACGRDLAVSGHEHRFGKQDFASDRRPGHACDDARFVAVARLFVGSRLVSEVIRDIFHIDLDRFLFAGHDLGSRCARRL